MFVNNFHYILFTFNYTGPLITSMFLALSICVLSISFMQSVNNAQFLNSTSLFLLFGATTIPVFETVMVPLTAMYASL